MATITANAKRFVGILSGDLYRWRRRTPSQSRCRRLISRVFDGRTESFGMVRAARE
jgi:hypothetical protein